MPKENILLVLWTIFGFLFISAIDSILYFIIHMIYFGLAVLGAPYKTMMFLIPITTLILYLATTFILINRIKLKTKISGIYLTEFPRKLIFILLILAFALRPITNKLSGLFAENQAQNIQVEISEYLSFYGMLHIGFEISRFIVVIILIFVSFNKMRSLNKN